MTLNQLKTTTRQDYKRFKDNRKTKQNYRIQGPLRYPSPGTRYRLPREQGRGGIRVAYISPYSRKRRKDGKEIKFHDNRHDQKIEKLAD